MAIDVTFHLLCPTFFADQVDHRINIDSPFGVLIAVTIDSAIVIVCIGLLSDTWGTRVGGVARCHQSLLWGHPWWIATGHCVGMEQCATRDHVSPTEQSAIPGGPIPHTCAGVLVTCTESAGHI